jgi:molybdate transport system regulatory protein
MKPKYNLWIEKDDQVVLSTWRVQLLRAIEESGSISSAAEVMDVPYRRAWEKIHEMEERLGEPLIVTEVGGVKGGGAQLTTLAQDLIQRFQVFSSGFNQEVVERFERAFSKSGK